jgi:hypothetical protein
VLAAVECEPCDWSKVPFCKREGAPNACGKILCFAGEIGFGAGPSQCMRDTDGLIVPDSTRPGSCSKAREGFGSIRSIDEDICIAGKAVHRVRFERCNP